MKLPYPKAAGLIVALTTALLPWAATAPAEGAGPAAAGSTAATSTAAALTGPAAVEAAAPALGGPVAAAFAHGAHYEVDTVAYTVAGEACVNLDAAPAPATPGLCTLKAAIAAANAWAGLDGVLITALEVPGRAETQADRAIAATATFTLNAATPVTIDLGGGANDGEAGELGVVSAADPAFLIASDGVTLRGFNGLFAAGTAVSLADGADDFLMENGSTDPAPNPDPDTSVNPAPNPYQTWQLTSPAANPTTQLLEVAGATTAATISHWVTVGIGAATASGLPTVQAESIDKPANVDVIDSIFSDITAPAIITLLQTGAKDLDVTGSRFTDLTIRGPGVLSFSQTDLDCVDITDSVFDDIDSNVYNMALVRMNDALMLEDFTFTGNLVSRVADVGNAEGSLLSLFNKRPTGRVEISGNVFDLTETPGEMAISWHPNGAVNPFDGHITCNSFRGLSTPIHLQTTGPVEVARNRVAAPAGAADAPATDGQSEEVVNNSYGVTYLFDNDSGANNYDGTWGGYRPTLAPAAFTAADVDLAAGLATLRAEEPATPGSLLLPGAAGGTKWVDFYATAGAEAEFYLGTAPADLADGHYTATLTGVGWAGIKGKKVRVQTHGTTAGGQTASSQYSRWITIPDDLPGDTWTATDPEPPAGCGGAEPAASWAFDAPVLDAGTGQAVASGALVVAGTAFDFLHELTNTGQAPVEVSTYDTTTTQAGGGPGSAIATGCALGTGQSPAPSPLPEPAADLAYPFGTPPPGFPLPVGPDPESRTFTCTLTLAAATP